MNLAELNFHRASWAEPARKTCWAYLCEARQEKKHASIVNNKQSGDYRFSLGVGVTEATKMTSNQNTSPTLRPQKCI